MYKSLEFQTIEKEKALKQVEQLKAEIKLITAEPESNPDNLPHISIVKCKLLAEAGFRLFRANYTKKTIESFTASKMTFEEFKAGFKSANEINQELKRIDSQAITIVLLYSIKIGLRLWQMEFGR
jgi:hypothetical protein